MSAIASGRSLLPPVSRARLVVGGLQDQGPVPQMRRDGCCRGRQPSNQGWQNTPNEQDSLAKRKINCHTPDTKRVQILRARHDTRCPGWCYLTRSVVRVPHLGETARWMPRPRGTYLGSDETGHARPAGPAPPPASTQAPRLHCYRVINSEDDRPSGRLKSHQSENSRRHGREGTGPGPGRATGSPGNSEVISYPGKPQRGRHSASQLSRRGGRNRRSSRISGLPALRQSG